MQGRAGSRFTTWLLLLAVFLGAAFACRRQQSARFPHELHLAGIECGQPGEKACLTCASCHRAEELNALGVAKQREAAFGVWSSDAEPALPEADRCVSCHGEQATELLGRNLRSAGAAKPLAHSIHFEHQKHLAMPTIKGQCVFCHEGAFSPGPGVKPNPGYTRVTGSVFEQAGSSELFPPMSNCFQCHEHQAQFDRGECGPCHDPLEVQSLIPKTFARHDQAWKRHHEGEALKNPAMCQSCHAQQECDDCHNMAQMVNLQVRRPDALERTWVHPPDFLTRHAMEARSQPGRCMTCHTTSTCDSCHLERGVSGNALGARSPHPPGWVGGNPASINFHGRAARRDLVSCASCHDQGPATNCIQCHKVGGSGGNPHPGGKWSQRSTGDSMCRYCHDR